MSGGQIIIYVRLRSLSLLDPNYLVRLLVEFLPQISTGLHGFTE